MIKNIKSINILLTIFKDKYDQNAKAQKHLLKLCSLLEKAGMESGKPNWKYNAKGYAFLRIVRKATDSKPREYVYIGAKPEIMAEAFAGINRQKQYDELKDELRSASRGLLRIRVICYHIAH